jgi:serine/threonine-protein kinase
MIVKDMELTGEHLSNYKIIGKLGKGGMATVYKAHELSLNRVVALKVLSPQLSEDKDYIKRFQREAQAAAQLNHPHIVQIYAIGEEKGLHYFAMEYIKGKSLAHIAKEKGVLAPGKAVPIIKQVAEALGEAHGAGLVHRDIKPSNIMIDSLGRAKVTDFGIAYVSRAQTKLTREGSIIGTPEYLSPEQCEGKTVDQRSDIYSLGVTLYEVLTGKTPYEADTPVSMLMKIVKGDFPPISEVNPNVPASLRDIVEKMMQTDPNKRYADMEEVKKAFEEFEKSAFPSGKPAEKMPVTATYQEIEAQPGAAVPSGSGEGSKSSKWAAVVVAAVIVLLMGGAFAAKVLIFDKKESGPSSTSTTAVETKTASAETSSQQPAGTRQTAETETQQAVDPQPTTAESQSSQLETSTAPGQQTGELLQKDETSTTPVSPSTSGETAAQSTDAQPKTTTTPSSQPSTTYQTSTPVKTGITPSRKPEPPANSCIISAVGDEGNADLVTPYVQEILTRNNFAVIDGPSVADRDISEVARNHIVVEVKQIGATTLNYYGNSSQQYTVRLTIKVIAPKTGKIIAGPVSQTVKYTTLNAEENLREAVAKLIARIQPVLTSLSPPAGGA